MASIATIFPCRIVKSRTIIGRPRGATTTPTAPFTSTGCAARAATHRQRRHRLSARTSCLRPPERPPRLDGRRHPGRGPPASPESRHLARRPGRRRPPLAAARGRRRVRFATPSALRLGSPALTFHWPAPCTRRRARLASCRALSASAPISDLVEGDGKHVVQDERQPLGWLQHLQNDEQRQADRVGQQRFLFGIDSIRANSRSRQFRRVQRLLPSRFP